MPGPVNTHAPTRSLAAGQFIAAKIHKILAQDPGALKLVSSPPADFWTSVR